MSNWGAHVVALGVAGGVALFAFAERFSPVPVPVPEPEPVPVPVPVTLPVPVVSKGIRLLSFMSFITVCSVAAFMPLAARSMPSVSFNR